MFTALTTNSPSIRSILLLVVLVLAGAFGLLLKYGNGNSKATKAQGNVTLPVEFFIPERFWSGAGEAKLVKAQGRVVAALVPHHLVAGKLISEIFLQLQAQGVEKIILVGPNHYEKGANNVQYNSTNWQTDLGLVTGGKLFGNLPDTRPEVMVKEHSIAGLLPYLAHYVPSAQVFSIILKHNTKNQEVESLANTIVDAWDKGTVLVSSVDFSHYLPLEVAEQRDEYTRQVLLNMNENALYPLNNDYMDSPASVALLMKFCKKLGSKAFTIQNHANSAEVLSNPYLNSTTSYFTGYCVAG